MSQGERSANKSNHRGADYWKKIGIFKPVHERMASISNRAGTNKITKRLTMKSYRQQEKQLIREVVNQ